jgi:hypothetical protein
MSSVADIINKIQVRSAQSNPLVVAVPEAAAHAYQAHAADRNAILRSRLNNQQQEFINSLNAKTNEQLHKHRLAEGDNTHRNTKDQKTHESGLTINESNNAHRNTLARDKILHGYGQQNTRDAHINELNRLGRLYGHMDINALNADQRKYEMERSKAILNNELAKNLTAFQHPYNVNLTNVRGANMIANTRENGNQYRMGQSNDAEIKAKQGGFTSLDNQSDVTHHRKSVADRTLTQLYNQNRERENLLMYYMQPNIPSDYSKARTRQILINHGFTTGDINEVPENLRAPLIQQITTQIASEWSDQAKVRINALSAQIQGNQRVIDTMTRGGSVPLLGGTYGPTDNGGVNDLTGNPGAGGNTGAGSGDVDLGSVLGDPEAPDATTVDHNYIGNGIQKAFAGATVYSTASSLIKGGQVKAFTHMLRSTPDFPTKVSGAELDDIGKFAKNVLKGNNITLPQGATNQHAIAELQQLLANDKKGARLLKDDKVLKKELSKLYQKHAKKKAGGQMASLTGKVVAKAGLKGAGQMAARVAGGLAGGPVGWAVTAASLLWFAHDVYKAHSDAKSASK